MKFCLTKNLIVNLSLSVISIVVFSVVLELGTRMYGKTWSTQNFSGVFVDAVSNTALESTSPTIFDAALGWIPRPGILHLWGQTVVIRADGIRSNGTPVDPPKNREHSHLILAVGDSFTFGDQVADPETWPAILERKIYCTVINAGVFGYGVDQAFLRAKALLAQYEPDILIFSLIPDDIYRSELSVRTGVRKPYFDIDTRGNLMLKNSPVPYSPKKEKTRDLFRKIGGYSFLIHSIMIRLMPNYWIEPGSSVRAHHKGSEVVCLLMKQLKKFSQERQIKVIVLIQYDILTISAYLKKAERLVHGLEQDAIDVLDLKPAFQEIMNQTPERYASFFNKQGGHMSFEGNTFIAEQLELFMRQRSVL